MHVIMNVNRIQANLKVTISMYHYIWVSWNYILKLSIKACPGKYVSTPCKYCFLKFSQEWYHYVSL